MVTKSDRRRSGDREMPAGEFKATCLKVMDEVAQYRRTVTVTKHGKPVVRIVPLDLEDDDTDPVAGCLADRISVVGDIEAPPLPWTEWESYGVANATSSNAESSKAKRRK